MVRPANYINFIKYDFCQIPNDNLQCANITRCKAHKALKAQMKLS